ncbi:tubulin-like doman-containing protein [Sphingomonas silueang]|uniref:tubulin-like doman-containing protein n=1 Tax=Sphingomonas silueang TaxID=3156617 RepID=UPI0032B5F97C
MNHLMIGLGGTGGKVIAGLRRAIFQQYGDVAPPELAVDFLYIDSSVHDTEQATVTSVLQDSDQRWRTNGRSVQLLPAQVVLLKQGNVAQIIEQVEDYGTIRSWIGDRALWRSIMAGAPNGIEAAGQLRRFGRLLAAQNVHAIDQAIKMRLDGTGGVQLSEWTFHVVAGLAGGTGSGTLIDLIGHLRSLSQGQRGKIVIYAVLPEEEDTHWAKGNYHANGYAALSEINALLAGSFSPTDIAGTGARYDFRKPIDNIWVMSPTNDQALRVDVGVTLPNLCADAIYQVVIASGMARALDAEQATQTSEQGWRAMTTGENFRGEYEGDSTEATAPKTRANRFTSFGISRVAIPTQEIAEYASASFTRQFLLQSLNNAWLDGTGFVETRKPFDVAAEVRSPERRNGWYLSDQHLRIETASLDNDKATWRSIADEFRGAINGKTTAIIGGDMSSDGWPRALDEFARGFSERQFRLVGVSEFYRVAERGIVDRARHIVHHRIGPDLFAKWNDGTWSLRDIARILEELIADTGERMRGFDGRIAEATRREGECATRLTQQETTFRNSSKISPMRLVRSRPQMLEAIAQAQSELHTARADKVAFGFAQRLSSAILTELQRLRADAEEVAKRFAVALETVERRQAARVRVDGNGDAVQLHKLYDPEHIRDVVRRLEQDEGLQRLRTAELRGKLLEQLGPQRSFAALVERVNDARIVATLEEPAQAAVEATLDALDSDRDHILQGRVIQKLYDEYASRDDALRKFLGTQLRRAASFAPLDPNQRIAHGVGAITRRVAAFVPAEAGLSDELRAFRTRMVGYIRSAASEIPVDIIDTADRDHEIVFLSLTNQFALRHLRSLARLRDKYREMVDGPDGARKRLELHIEGDGTTLPSLFARGIDELRADMRPYWLIGQVETLFRERTNPTTGAPEVFFVVRDEHGRERPVVIGDTIVNGTARLTGDTAYPLQARVERHLAGLVHVDARAGLMARLAEHQNEVMRRFDYDETRPEVRGAIADVAAACALVNQQRAAA